MRCCLSYHKRDWAEYGSSFGYPTWQDALRPCFGCPAVGPGMFVAMANGPAGLRWSPTTDDDYNESCNRCEYVVVVANEALRRLLVMHLRYDKRKDGAHGRALTRDLADVVPPP